MSKRRTPATAQDLERLAFGAPDPSWKGYWYHRRLLVRGLRPVCQIRYRRAAWLAATSEGLLRLTLDDCLNAAPISQALFDESPSGTPLLTEEIVLELKYRTEVPALFTQLIQQFGLNPVPVSKYRLATASLGLAPQESASPSTNGSPSS